MRPAPAAVVGGEADELGAAGELQVLPELGRRVDRVRDDVRDGRRHLVAALLIISAEAREHMPCLDAVLVRCLLDHPVGDLRISHGTHEVRDVVLECVRHSQRELLGRSPLRKRPQRKHEQMRLVNGLFAGLHRLGVAHRDQSPESLPAVVVLLERLGLLARSLELRPQKRCRRSHSAIESIEQALPELAHVRRAFGLLERVRVVDRQDQSESLLLHRLRCPWVSSGNYKRFWHCIRSEVQCSTWRRGAEGCELIGRNERPRILPPIFHIADHWGLPRK